MASPTIEQLKQMSPKFIIYYHAAGTSSVVDRDQVGPSINRSPSSSFDSIIYIVTRDGSLQILTVPFSCDTPWVYGNRNDGKPSLERYDSDGQANEYILRFRLDRLSTKNKMLRRLGILKTLCWVNFEAHSRD